MTALIYFINETNHTELMKAIFPAIKLLPIL